MKNNTYEINEIQLSENVFEISVAQAEWGDMQMVDEEPTHILLAPTGAFAITDLGLSPIRRERDLWECIPKIVEVLEDFGEPHFADNQAAEEVFNHILDRIKEECPNWKFIERRDTTKKRR
jgi:hypothetical protein